MKELTLVISGQICRENSANLFSFWQGFINIQNALYNIDELNVIAHSWNPEFDELIKKVYSISHLISEKQPNFVKEYMPLLNPVDKFEHGLKRLKSTWKNCSYQAILGNAKSRSKAISLLQKLDINDNAAVLAVRWDQGCTGSKNVNTVIFDGSLIIDYLYLSYYSEIDEGYADMWFIAPVAIARQFELYDNYVLDALADRNNYFKCFTQSGWPLAIKRNKVKYRVKQFKNIILKKIFSIVRYNGLKLVMPFIANKITGFQKRIENEMQLPLLSGENSLLVDSKTNIQFPTYLALNNHAILKSFILDGDLREKTRFLDVDDFELNHKGIMINPIKFTYVIYSHSSFSDCWAMAVGQAFECLPDNCSKVYLVSEESEQTLKAFSTVSMKSNVELITYNESVNYTNRLISIFKEIAENHNYAYFVHEDMPLTSKVDQVFLNSLLHFMNNSNEYYIKLVDTNYVDSKVNHECFPGLVTNKGGYSFSVQPALLKPEYIISFLTNFNTDIYGLEQVCTNANLTFSAVKGSRKVGRYLLANQSFPHIATAISKGKWCTDEWPEEINSLARLYNIDLSTRGEVGA